MQTVGNCTLVHSQTKLRVHKLLHLTNGWDPVQVYTNELKMKKTFFLLLKNGENTYNDGRQVGNYACVLCSCQMKVSCNLLVNIFYIHMCVWVQNESHQSHYCGSYRSLLDFIFPKIICQDHSSFCSISVQTCATFWDTLYIFVNDTFFSRRHLFNRLHFFTSIIQPNGSQLSKAEWNIVKSGTTISNISMM